MRLRVILPGEVLIDEPVSRIVAEAPNGSFGLLPRQADFTAALVAGNVPLPGAAGTPARLADTADEGWTATLDGKPLSAAEITKALTSRALEHGLIVLACGVYGNVVRFLVPLTASDALIEEGLGILERAYSGTRPTG